MKNKFLGICIIIAAVMLSGTLIYTKVNTQNRYKVAGAKVFDTQEGVFVKEQTETQTTKKYQWTAKDFIDMDEVDKLLKMKNNNEYLNPQQRSTLNDYYKTQYETWAKQYYEDNINGKILNYSKYDIGRIEIGLAPKGTYKNKSEEPSWLSEMRYDSDGGLLGK
jgi:putative lipase involved disintegration of autophagic bodies